MMFNKQSISLLHRSFKYKNKLYMANRSYNRNVSVDFYNFHIFIMFLKKERVESLIIITMSLIYRYVPNSKHPYSQCIQKKPAHFGG